MAHVFDGYNYLLGLGYDTAATICLTHSFPIKEVGTYFGSVDCSNEEVAFLQAFLDGYQYNDYDRLIQLCDAIALPQGAVLMEKRLVDVALRHGMPEWTRRKWKSFFALKEHFDSLVGYSVYKLMPGIEHNTFEW